MLILLIFLLLFTPAKSFQDKDFSWEKLEQLKSSEKLAVLEKITESLISSEPSRVLTFSKEALILAKQLNDLRYSAKANSLIGECLIKLGSNSEAINYFEEALLIYRKIKDKKGIAKTLSDLGNANRFIGFYEKALDLLTESLKLAEEDNNYESQIIALNNVGIIHRNFKRDSTALKYYNLALELSKKNNSVLGEAITLNNLGSFYWFKGDNKKAFAFYNESLSKHRQLSEKNDKVSALLNNIGNVYRSEKNYEKALAYYDSSLTISREIGDKNLQTVTLKNIAIIFMQKGEYSASEYYLKQAYKLAIETSQKRFLIEVYSEFSNLYRFMGNYEQAFQYQSYFYKTRDSIISEENSNRIAELDFRYKQEKKFKETQNEIDEQKSRFTLFVTVFSVLLVLSLIFLYNRYTEVNKVNKELVFQKNKLEFLNKELNTSRTKYLTLFESIGDPLLLIDVATGKILEANSAAIKSYGYSYSEFTNLTTADISELIEDFNQSMEFDNIFLPVRIHKRKNGQTFPVEILAKSFFIDEKKLLVASIRDITERKKAEETLQHSEILFRSVWENSKDGMRLIDENGIITLVNNAYCKLFEREREELLNRDYKEYLLENIEDTSSEEGKKFSIKAVSSSYEREIILWNGKKIWVEFSNSVIIDADGKEKLLSVLRDISQRKNTEEKLVETNKSKDKLFSIIAHDLKSPFQGLIGFSDILLEEVDELPINKIKQYVGNISKITRNLYTLVEQLLEWSRLQMDKVSFKREDTLIASTVKLVTNILQPNAFAKDIKIEANIPPGFHIFCDENMIRIVLENLISNAIKFSSPGGVIKVSSSENEKEKIICVEDDGVGIKEEDKQKLFKIESTFTTEGTMKEKGTGLGLLLCKEIIEKHHGKIWVESTLGKGSKFFFSLPVNS